MRSTLHILVLVAEPIPKIQVLGNCHFCEKMLHFFFQKKKKIWQTYTEYLISDNRSTTNLLYHQILYVCRYRIEVDTVQE